MENQDQLIKSDGRDLKELSFQINKVQKLKSNFQGQKRQIETLSQKISELKSQNEDLKCVTLRNPHMKSETKNEKETLTEQFYSGDRHHPSSEILVTRPMPSQLNCSRCIYQQNPYALSKKRPCTPQHQPHSEYKLDSLTHQSSLQRFGQEIFRQNIHTQFHSNRKHDTPLHNNHLGNNFIQELQREIDQKSMQLKKQRKAHIQAQKQLQYLKEQISRISGLASQQQIMSQENYSLREQVTRENEQKLILREQINILRRKLTKEKGKSERLAAGYDCYQDYGECLDQELNRMDQIYMKISQIIKHE